MEKKKKPMWMLELESVFFFCHLQSWVVNYCYVALKYAEGGYCYSEDKFTITTCGRWAEETGCCQARSRDEQFILELNVLREIFHDRDRNWDVGWGDESGKGERGEEISGEGKKKRSKGRWEGKEVGREGERKGGENIKKKALKVQWMTDTSIC